MAEKALATGVRRILGNQDHLGREASATDWTAPSEEEVDKMPPLPEAGQRGWEVPAPGADAEATPPLPDGVAEDSTHAFVFRHPEQAAAVLRTVLRSDESGPADGPLAGMTSRQLAAAFLCGLGEEIGSCVVVHLRQEDQIMAVQGIALQGAVPHKTCMHVLELVRQRMVAGDYLEEGGTDYAVRLLWRVFGPNHAHAVVNRALKPGGGGFDEAGRFSAEQVAAFIVAEHPQTIALFLGQMQPQYAAGIIAKLPEKVQVDVAHRIAVSEDVSPESLEGAAETFANSLQCAQEVCQVGGPGVVADIIHLTSAGVEKNVLGNLDTSDPELAKAIRDAMGDREEIGKTAAKEE